MDVYMNTLLRHKRAPQGSKEDEDIKITQVVRDN
jgi:hypothetical protein